MAASRTPTPWTAEPQVGRGAWIKGADDKWSALACGETDENGAANAAFIVRACNAHDALVAALEGVLPMAEAWADGKSRFHPDHEWIEAAHAALSAAEGRS